MSFNKIVVAGAGVQGSQIAVQMAFKGIPVTVWVRNDESKGRAEKKIEAVKNNYIGAINAMQNNHSLKFSAICKGDDGYKHVSDYMKAIEDMQINIVTNANDAFSDADLIIETIKEDTEVKKDFFKMISPIVKEGAIVTSNSSTYAPSQFVDYVPNKERFLWMHFFSPMISCNLVEIMGHAGTDTELIEELYEFTLNEMGMSPLKIMKEIPRGVMNFMLIPWMAKAAYLWGADIASPQDIDMAWMNGTMHCVGPFKLMDEVGLGIVYEVCKTLDGVDVEGTPFNIVKKRIENMMANREKFYN